MGKICFLKLSNDRSLVFAINVLCNRTRTCCSCFIIIFSRTKPTAKRVRPVLKGSKGEVNFSRRQHSSEHCPLPPFELRPPPPFSLRRFFRLRRVRHSPESAAAATKYRLLHVVRPRTPLCVLFIRVRSPIDEMIKMRACWRPGRNWIRTIIFAFTTLEKFRPPPIHTHIRLVVLGERNNGKSTKMKIELKSFPPCYP